MRPLITYYGGKQKLCHRILPLIPKHKIYAEPFAGGAAVFFAKGRSPVEVLNDTNGEVINFYRVVKEQFGALYEMIEKTIRSRIQFREANIIYHNSFMFSDIERAWAYWVMAEQSFGRKMATVWGIDRSGPVNAKHFLSRKKRFTDAYVRRLEAVELENTDALYLIKTRDTSQTFFYVDPPYIDADCAPYSKYYKADFIMLLESLSGIRGKFLLSSYPNEILNENAAQNHWPQISMGGKVEFTSPLGRKKTKTEILTANYPLNNELWTIQNL